MWRRIDGTYIYCEDNAGVIINQKGDPKDLLLMDLLQKNVLIYMLK